MYNNIPENFNRIIGKILINTKMDRKGDEIHVYPKGVHGYVCYNIRNQTSRTRKKYTIFFCGDEWLLNSRVFEITSIQ